MSPKISIIVIFIIVYLDAALRVRIPLEDYKKNVPTYLFIFNISCVFWYNIRRVNKNWLTGEFK